MTFAPPKDTTLRRAIFGRTGGACAYCNAALDYHSTEWEVEHVQPKAAGGSNARENLLPACGWCNRTKADRDPEGFRWAAALLIRSAFQTLLILLRRFARDPHTESVVDCVELGFKRWEAGGQVTFAREGLLRQGEVSKCSE